MGLLDNFSGYTKVRHLIQIDGSTDQVYLYKEADPLSSHSTIIDNGSQVIATKISLDGNWYYIPAKKMWIPTGSTIVVSRTPDPNYTITQVYRTNKVNENKTISPDATESSTDGRLPIFPTTLVARAAEEVRATAERLVENPTWHQIVTGNDVAKDKKSKDVIIPNLVETGPVDTIGHVDGNLESGFLMPGLTKQNKAFTNDLRNAAKYDFNGIFGIPYQFLPTVDRRFETATSVTTGLGRKYAEKILTRNNLIYLTPCVQNFMGDADDADRTSVIAALNDLVEGGANKVESVLSSLEHYGRYYTTEGAFGDYIVYVNSMCTAVAQYMGIGDCVVNIGGRSSALRSFDWKNAVNVNFQKYAGVKSTVVFYADSLNSVSDDFSNDSRESSLASTVNGVSDEAKELNFILKRDYSDSSKFKDSLMEGIGHIGEGLDISGNRGIITAIGENARALLAGGKITFPEIWGDSGHDVSYSINFKFRTPDCDPVSIYLNIIVPFLHLMALTAPRDYGAPETSNSYKEPFLCHATFKGMFSIDYGLITSLSCDRGGEGSWTVDGLPTQMDVSLTIKDLYKSLFISKGDGWGGSAARFCGNDGLTDYLMGVAGVNMALPVWSEKAAAYLGLVENHWNPIRAFGRMGTKFQTDYGNLMDNIFGRFL